MKNQKTYKFGKNGENMQFLTENGGFDIILDTVKNGHYLINF